MNYEWCELIIIYSPDCIVFVCACIDNSSFRCGSSYYLVQISWIFVCRASFHQVAALIALSGYFFSTHTMLSTIKPKSYCLLLLKKRCKVVVARATYFISLKDVSFASKNHEANIADTAGIEPAALGLECGWYGTPTHTLPFRRGMLCAVKLIILFWLFRNMHFSLSAHFYFLSQSSPLMSGN